MHRDTHTINAENKIVGRLASKIAFLLQGKHKATYQPYTDCGDIVEVMNVSNVKFTGKKLLNKVYHRFTGYPGGLKTTRLSHMYTVKPEILFRRIVFNMLPKNKLRQRMINRLRFIQPKKKET